MARNVASAGGLRMALAGGQTSETPCGESGERNVSQEQPAPAEVRYDQAADDGAADACGREHHGEISLKPDPFHRRHELADECLRERHQAASTEALQYARADELRHGVREAACN